jgi:hypothetical protein
MSGTENIGFCGLDADDDEEVIGKDRKDKIDR